MISGRSRVCRWSGSNAASFVVVGEDDETVWRIAGQLADQYRNRLSTSPILLEDKASFADGPRSARRYLRIWV